MLHGRDQGVRRAGVQHAAHEFAQTASSAMADVGRRAGEGPSIVAGATSRAEQSSKRQKGGGVSRLSASQSSCPDLVRASTPCDGSEKTWMAAT